MRTHLCAALALLAPLAVAACTTEFEGDPPIDLVSLGDADQLDATYEGYIRANRPSSFRWTCADTYCDLSLALAVRPTDADLEGLRQQPSNTTLEAARVEMTRVETGEVVDVAYARYDVSAGLEPTDNQFVYLPQPRGVYDIEISSPKDPEDEDSLVREYHFSLAAGWERADQVAELVLSDATLGPAANDGDPVESLYAQVSLTHREHRNNSSVEVLSTRPLDGRGSASWLDEPMFVVSLAQLEDWTLNVWLIQGEGSERGIAIFESGDAANVAPLTLDGATNDLIGSNSKASVRISAVPLD